MKSKNKIYGWAAALLGTASLFTACEQELPVYSDPQSRLKFNYIYAQDTLTNKSFAYHNSPTDTVWVTVQLMGFPADVDRIIPLKQVPVGEYDAVPGEHYVPFDDPELVSKYYYMPKGEVVREVPIVLKRSSSLETNDYNLRVTIGENEFFSPGAKESLYKRVVISGQLVKPKDWEDYFLGQYGRVKHRFMIDATGFKWDDDYVTNTFYYYQKYDQNYCFYIVGLLSQALAEYEAEHGILYEEDGTVVSFPF